jgi:glycosyltransferase involved in cell wall biosynthesis
MVALAFIGNVAPPDAFRSQGFSQAGSMFQRRLLSALRDAGQSIDRIYAVPPEQFFPQGPLVVRGRKQMLDGLQLTTLPYLNTGVLQFSMLSAQIAARVTAWGLARRRRRRGVLLYNVDPIPGVASIAAAHSTGTRVVGVIADVHVPGASRPDDLLHRVQYFLQRRALQQLDGLVVLTREMALDFATGKPWIEMHGAVPDDRLLQLPADQPEGEVRFVYAGQLTHLKGVTLLLEAMKLVRRANIRLWISGRGPEEQAVRDAAAADQRITYQGYGEYEAVLDLYRRASVLVNPHAVAHASARYMFPSKLFEYLATGKPVLSTRSAAVERDYAPYLHLIDATPRAMADGIEEMARATPAWREQLGRSGRAFVARERTWEVQGRRVSAFLDRIFEQRR